jgi:hypothetical protein
MVVFTLLVLLYAWYVERNTPRWKRVYFYLRREFGQDNYEHTAKDLLDIKINLLERYDLKASQVDLAIENMYDEEWFKVNIV